MAKPAPEQLGQPCELISDDDDDEERPLTQPDGTARVIAPAAGSSRSSSPCCMPAWTIMALVAVAVPLALALRPSKRVRSVAPPRAPEPEAPPRATDPGGQEAPRATDPGRQQERPLDVVLPQVTSNASRTDGQYLAGLEPLLPLQEEAEKISLFCFTFTPLRPLDWALLAEVRIQFAKCAGYFIFTDDEAPGEAADDIIRIHVPNQTTARSSLDWLYHRNMVGLIPTWKYLLENGLAEKYDWLINSELDHFMSPTRVRLGIAAYLDGLRHDRDRPGAAEGPLILMFGNAFLFNRKTVQVMAQQWHRLGQVGAPGTAENGCPEIQRGHAEWPDHCSQDMVYLTMGMEIQPSVLMVGVSGCGQRYAQGRLNSTMPLTCWEMSSEFYNPFSADEAGQLRAIEELAFAQHLRDPNDGREHYLSAGDKVFEQWQQGHWFDARLVPLIHHVGSVAAHAHARQLLLP